MRDSQNDETCLQKYMCTQSLCVFTRCYCTASSPTEMLYNSVVSIMLTRQFFLHIGNALKIKVKYVEEFSRVSASSENEIVMVSTYN